MLDLTGHMIMWPSVVVHEHWPVSKRMILEIRDYAWSEHIVTVFLACQITIKNVQVQLTVKGKTTIEPELYSMFYSKRLFRQFHGLRCPQT
jgi:hypothetical protein